jgi:hypothetical protein
MHTRVTEPWRLAASSAGWTLFEHDQPVRTPLGAPVGSRHHPLARRMLENVRSFGGPALLPPTPYGLQVLYLDFARSVPAAHLSRVVLSCLEGRRRLPDDLRPVAAARATSAVDARETDPEVRRQAVAGLSTRSLLAVLAFDAQFENPQAGLDVITGRADLDGLAAGLCAFVAERRIASGLEGDPRYYAPVAERDEDFCREHCLPTIAPLPSEDRECLARTPSRCGTRRMLEGFRFFVSFPEE